MPRVGECKLRRSPEYPQRPAAHRNSPTTISISGRTSHCDSALLAGQRKAARGKEGVRTRAPGLVDESNDTAAFFGFVRGLWPVEPMISSWVVGSRHGRRNSCTVVVGGVCLLVGVRRVELLRDGDCENAPSSGQGFLNTRAGDAPNCSSRGPVAGGALRNCCGASCPPGEHAGSPRAAADEKAESALGEHGKMEAAWYHPSRAGLSLFRSRTFPTVAF